MVALNTWPQLKHHATQQKLWGCDSRFVVIVAGRGSGKTMLAKRKLVMELPKIKPWSDARYFYGAPTHQQAKRIAWDDFIRMIPQNWLDGPKAINQSELSITTRFGSKLWIVGLDNPARIEGVQWDGCVLDESSDLKPKTFELSILPALSWRKGWCWRQGVPKRHGPGAADFRDCFEKALGGSDPEWVAFSWPSSEIVPAELLKASQEILDAKDYMEQFEARFQTVGGSIYYAYDEEYNVRPCSYQKNLPIIVGSDFNVDPMCWVFGHRFTNRVEWFDELWLRDCNTEHALDVSAKRYSGHQGGFEFYGDATSKARKSAAAQTDYEQILNHEGFKRMGRTIHYPQSNPAVADRWAAVNAMFRNAAGERRMFIDPQCKRLRKDLQLVSFKPGTRESAAKDDMGHITDAMGYPVHYLFPIQVSLEWGSQEVSIYDGEIVA